MKIINIEINNTIKPINYYDTDTKKTGEIYPKLEIPAGNVNVILLNFNFISPNVDNLDLFAIFNAKHLEKPIEVQIKEHIVDEILYEKSCFIPYEVLEEKGYISLGIFGFILNDDETLNKRISLEPIEFGVIEGSYDKEAAEGGIPIPSDLELYFEKIKVIKTDGTGNKFLSDDGTYKEVSESSGSGTTNYTDLENKPSINNVELSGNKTLEELGIQPKGNYTTAKDVQSIVDKAFEGIVIAEEVAY